MSRRTKQAKQTKSAHKHDAAWYPVLRILSEDGAMLSQCKIEDSPSYNHPYFSTEQQMSGTLSVISPASDIQRTTKSVLDELLDAGLVEKHDSSHFFSHYRITDKGRQALAGMEFRGLDNLINTGDKLSRSSTMKTREEVEGFKEYTELQILESYEGVTEEAITAMEANVDFVNTDKCHDWRNHVPGEIYEIWGDLPSIVRAAVYVVAAIHANQEEWE